MEMSSSGGTSASSSSGGGGQNLLTYSDGALKAKPIAASNSGEPSVLDSWTKEDRNYYIIYVGEIRNTFVSEIAYVHYIGFPMGFSKTTATERTVINSMTETVSNSIAFSNTSQTKLTLEAAVKAKIKIVDFSVGLKLEESATSSVSSARSTETSVYSLTSTVESEASTVSFEIGNRGEAVGHYRYSLYDVSDVYFVISTSLDNNTLLSWDVISCARGSYTRHWEYSDSGKFDNSPTKGSEINFAEDFYKTLPKPNKTVRSLVEEKKFTAAGSHPYIFDKNFPATVEVYALGAGGGGQGGHFSDLMFGGYGGTGGAGGGGAAAYMKFSIEQPITFNIKVGKGGNGGTAEFVNWVTDWRSGNPGDAGENTTVTWGANTLSAEGGAGGGGIGQNLIGGSGGGGSRKPAIVLAENWATVAGFKGTDGTRDGNIASIGGNAAEIANKGSVAFFGGGKGGVKDERGAESGGGGSSRYGRDQSGSAGGNGQVIIVVTYFEK
jgi:hypothetical protein